ncbi:Co2+/Mg2+ efflux protein ApaG [Thalassotalea piscium]
MNSTSEKILASKINVTVNTSFVTELVDNGEPIFVFSYTIKIHNSNTLPVQLISRYWLITDGEGEEVEVSGDGVVGQQPIIEAGKTYEYSSGCHLKTPFGTMQGHYVMKSTHHNEPLEVTIPLFRLALPYCVN